MGNHASDLFILWLACGNFHHLSLNFCTPRSKRRKGQVKRIHHRHVKILQFLKGTGRKLPISCVFTYCIYSFHHNIHWCSHSLLFRSQCILLHWNKTLLLLLCNHYLKAFIFRTRYPFKFKGDSMCLWLM